MDLNINGRNIYVCNRSEKGTELGARSTREESTAE